MSVIATAAPSFANRRAIARPDPFPPAPVTTTTLPLVSMQLSMRLFAPEELIKCDMLHEPVSAILEGTGMLVRCASPALRSYLGCFWALVGEAPASVETLPDGCAQFTVELNRSAEPRVFLSGPRETG